MSGLLKEQYSLLIYQHLFHRKNMKEQCAPKRAHNIPLTLTVPPTP